MGKKRSALLSMGALLSLVARPPAANAEWPMDQDHTGWPTAGHDLDNSRSQPDEKAISPQTAAQLKLRWSVETAGDVTASPAIDGDYIYFTDSGGFLYKVAQATGEVIWKQPVSMYTGVTGDYARATPAISGDTLILGNQSGHLLGSAFSQPPAQPAQVFAADKNTGAKLWSRQVDPTALSFVTNSAVVANGLAIVGVASNEELVAAFVPPANWTWHFRGSALALDVRTGSIVWQTYTVPPGYFGGSIWGSTAAVDVARHQVYLGTGNNYAVPQSVLDCLNAGGKPPACISSDNHNDSIIALDLYTGAINWTARGLPVDVWNVGCGLSVPGFNLPPNGNCPNPKGPDWDFAQGPMLFGRTDANGRSSYTSPGLRDGNQLVGAGEKSGMFWAFKPGDGQLAWATQVAPPGLTGGLQWGSATDGQSIFVAVSNSGPTGAAQNPLPWLLKDGTTTTSGGWAAVDAKTGQVVWTTKDPAGSRAEAAVSVANGVVFGCNLDPANGAMYALDAATGTPLWHFNSGGACNAGPSISDGVVYWGTGTYSGVGPKKLFAFSLGG